MTLTEQNQTWTELVVAEGKYWRTPRGMIRLPATPADLKAVLDGLPDGTLIEAVVDAWGKPELAIVFQFDGNISMASQLDQEARLKMARCGIAHQRMKLAGTRELVDLDGQRFELAGPPEAEYCVIASSPPHVS